MMSFNFVVLCTPIDVTLSSFTILLPSREHSTHRNRLLHPRKYLTFCGLYQWLDLARGFARLDFDYFFVPFFLWKFLPNRKVFIPQTKIKNRNDPFFHCVFFDNLRDIFFNDFYRIKWLAFLPQRRQAREWFTVNLRSFILNKCLLADSRAICCENYAHVCENYKSVAYIVFRSVIKFYSIIVCDRFH